MLGFNSEELKELNTQVQEFVKKYSKPGKRGAVKSVSDDEPVFNYKINTLYSTMDRWVLNPHTFEKYLPGVFTEEEANAALEQFCADYNLTLEHLEEGLIVKAADDTLLAPCAAVESDEGDYHGWAYAGLAVNYAVVDMIVDEGNWGRVEITTLMDTMTIGSFTME